MTLNEKLALIEETFEMEEGTLEPDMVLADIDEFDSIAKLSLIVLMDDEFGKTIKTEDIKALKIVQDIIDLMD